MRVDLIRELAPTMPEGFLAGELRDSHRPLD